MSDMQQTVREASAVIDTLTTAILGTLKTAAEKIGLATQVAQAQQRAEALFAVLEGVTAHRQALEDRLAEAKGPIRAMLAHQIAAIEAQQESILVSAGLTPEAAKEVFAPQSLPAPEPEPGKVVVRAHVRTKKGELASSTNGSPVEN